MKENQNPVDQRERFNMQRAEGLWYELSRELEAGSTYTVVERAHLDFIAVITE